LGRYPALIKSMTKASKPGILTLEELDKFRYEDAPAAHAKMTGGVTMELQDVQKLVDWKLRHGTFRPTLPKLVASNTNDSIQQITADAFALYETFPSDTSAVIKKLSELKGIGPATASLLLAVYDPDHVIFFSDEAYRWLCCNGESTKVKYTTKEFDDLFEKAKSLMNRLHVTALDIEKVAYVLMKEAEPIPEPKVPKEAGEKRPRGRPAKPRVDGPPEDKGPKRPRGRPAKVKVEVSTPNGEGDKKKRGRPGKQVDDEVATPATNKSSKRKVADEEQEDTPGRHTKKRA